MRRIHTREIVGINRCPVFRYAQGRREGVPVSALLQADALEPGPNAVDAPPPEPDPHLKIIYDDKTMGRDGYERAKKKIRSRLNAVLEQNAWLPTESYRERATARFEIEGESFELVSNDIAVAQDFDGAGGLLTLSCAPSKPLGLVYVAAVDAYLFSQDNPDAEIAYGLAVWLARGEVGRDTVCKHSFDRLCQVGEGIALEVVRRAQAMNPSPGQHCERCADQDCPVRAI